jgi:branched-chain amino acid transport system substrate-binding protein
MFKRTQRHTLRLVASLLLVASTVGCTKSCSNQNENPSATSNVPTSTADGILVGEYGSMTGSEATFGVSTHRGLEMALEEGNKTGGVKGKKVVLISLDDQGKPEEAAAAVSRLVTQNKVVAVIGEVASSRTLAAAPIAQENKIPMISPSSTNPKVTEVGDYIFRVCFIDPFQGTVMAKFAAQNLKAKRVAILRDVKSDYSVGLANFFVQTFKELGGEVIDDQSYQAGEIDFKGQLTAIRAKKPDAIFVPGYYTEVGLIARQARQLGLKVPLLGGDGWDSAKLYEIGGEAINGSYFSNHYTTESTDPTVKDFIGRYKARYGEVPDGLAALGYDSGKVLIEALQRSDLSPKSLRDEISKTKDYAGVTGKITINEQRNAVKSAVVVRVDGNVNRYVTTINP